MAAYLEAVFEDGDPALITHALGVIARAEGMTEVARQTGLTRASLYKALSADGHPEFATVMKVMRALGLLYTHLALILLNATFVLPFVVVIVRQTFLDLPVELEESAMVDGCSHLSAFWLIALPLAAPSIAATGLIMFAFTWNEFIFALTISSREAITVPVHMAGAIDTRGVQFWFMGVRAMIAMIPPVIIALLAQRYIVRGLTLGAVKG